MDSENNSKGILIYIKPIKLIHFWKKIKQIEKEN